MTLLGTTADLGTPAEALRAFMKARARLDGGDAVVWFAGEVHAMEPAAHPGGGHTHLYGFEGFNIARAIEVDGGFDLLSREAVFYLDPDNREILEKWDNPFTGETVDVIHVWNDPVNFPLRLEGPRPVHVAGMHVGDDIAFNQDIFLAYPSPLPRAEFPQASQSDLYQAAELFQYLCPADELTDPASVSSAARVSWTRIAPWLPWMGMADRPGNLVYHCRGTKIDGYDALPERIRGYVEDRHPEYRTAPDTFTQPNETSWTYYRKLTQETS